MDDEIFDETEETLDDLLERVEAAANHLTHATTEIGQHMAGLIDALVSLDAPAAVNEAAGVADSAVTGAADAAGETVAAGVDAVKMPVDVVQDVAKPLESRRVRKGLRWRHE